MLKIYFFEDTLNKYTKPDFSALGKLIAKSIYAKIKGVPLQSVIIEKGKNGKPYFKGENNFHFNISHSKNGVAVAFSICEIGIDIEKLREFDSRVANRYFSTEELSYSHNDNKKRFEIWTKKECALKAKGLSLKSIKNINTENTFSFSLSDFIISVCCEDYKNHELYVLSDEEVAFLLENRQSL